MDHADDQGSSSAFGIAAVVLGFAVFIMPYFVAMFCIPAAIICGLIAIKQKRQVAGLIGLIFALLGLAVIVMPSDEIFLETSDPSPARINPALSRQITLATYIQLKRGMSFSRVSEIIGESGEEIDRAEEAGNEVQTYEWRNFDGTSFRVVFTNGKLTHKSPGSLRYEPNTGF